MRVVMFCHSIVSDWNHAHVHFLRGIVTELQRRQHHVRVYEPAGGWSRTHLLAEQGPDALRAYQEAYPHLPCRTHGPDIDVPSILAETDLAIVHDSTERALVARLGEARRALPRLRLLFHDTHHRGVRDQDGVALEDLRHYDGLLAGSRLLRDRALADGRIRQAWTWHPAADIGHFRPRPLEPREGDLVWIGNWADERRADLLEFFVEPVRRLGLRAACYGVRYPPDAVAVLEAAGIQYRGWVANHEVPRVLARYAATLHLPRRSGVRPPVGPPTIRPFEALACSAPLVSAPWEDADGLFRPGVDFLQARDGAQMTTRLATLRAEPATARTLAANGRLRVLERHTCMHRVNDLVAIHASLAAEVPHAMGA